MTSHSWSSDMSLLVPSRRVFIGGLLSALAAPAIVHIGNVRPVKAIVPFGPSIGDIKPIVGAIPEGWVECNGQWLISRAHTELRNALGVEDDPRGLFFVPDMRAKARDVKVNGEWIGRYVIYAGEQAARHRRSVLSHMPLVHEQGSHLMYDHSYSIGERA